MCWYKSRSVADKLVDTNNLAGDSDRFDILDIALSLSAPRSSIVFAVAASGAYRRGDICDLPRKDACKA